MSDLERLYKTAHIHPADIKASLLGETIIVAAEATVAVAVQRCLSAGGFAHGRAELDWPEVHTMIYLNREQAVDLQQELAAILAAPQEEYTREDYEADRADSMHASGEERR